MSRPKLATIAGIVFILLYMVAVTELPQRLGRMHWALEALYWCAAGILWVFPVRWLMLWSVGNR